MEMVGNHITGILLPAASNAVHVLLGCPAGFERISACSLVDRFENPVHWYQSSMT